MRVAVFGAGYVGCVTATCLAGWGHDVWLSEISPEKLAILRAGKSPVFEPGLEDEFGAHLRTGRIRPLAGVADALAARLQPYTIVLRSTVPAPQLRRELLPLIQTRLGSHFGRDVQFALNPRGSRRPSTWSPSAQPVC